MFGDFSESLCVLLACSSIVEVRPIFLTTDFFHIHPHGFLCMSYSPVTGKKRMNQRLSTLNVLRVFRKH